MPRARGVYSYTRPPSIGSEVLHASSFFPSPLCAHRPDLRVHRDDRRPATGGLSAGSARLLPTHHLRRWSTKSLHHLRRWSIKSLRPRPRGLREPRSVPDTLGRTTSPTALAGAGASSTGYTSTTSRPRTRLVSIRARRLSLQRAHRHHLLRRSPRQSRRLVLSSTAPPPRLLSAEGTSTRPSSTTATAITSFTEATRLRRRWASRDIGAMRLSTLEGASRSTAPASSRTPSRRARAPPQSRAGPPSRRAGSPPGRAGSPPGRGELAPGRGPSERAGAERGRLASPSCPAQRFHDRRRGAPRTSSAVATPSPRDPTPSSSNRTRRLLGRSARARPGTSRRPEARARARASAGFCLALAWAGLSTPRRPEAPPPAPAQLRPAPARSARGMLHGLSSPDQTTRNGIARTARDRPQALRVPRGSRRGAPLVRARRGGSASRKFPVFSKPKPAPSPMTLVVKTEICCSSAAMGPLAITILILGAGAFFAFTLQHRLRMLSISRRSSGSTSPASAWGSS